MVILRPLRDQSKKMRISAGIVITSIVDIDFVEKHIDLNVEFIMKWTDELIDIKSGMKDQERHQLYIMFFVIMFFFYIFLLKVILKDLSTIWSPDLYVYNMKKFEMKTTSGKVNSVELRKKPEGEEGVEVSYVFEASIIIICDPDFKHFPFHKQACLLK